MNISRVLLLSIVLFFSNLTNAATYLIGDSLSDPGMLGFTFTDPLINKYASLKAGYGKVWTNYFYINNFAVGGSGITFSSPYSKTQDTSMRGQISNLSNITSEDTVIIFIGANDLLKCAQTNCKSIEEIIGTFASNINPLIEEGAKIYVIKMPASLPFSPGGKLYKNFNSLVMTFNRYIDSLTGIIPIDLSECPNPPPSDNLNGTVCAKNISPNQICGSTNNQLTTNKNTGSFPFADSIHPSSYFHKELAKCLGPKLNLIENN